MDAFIDNNGFIYPKDIADKLHTTIKEISELTGLPFDAVSKKQRITSKNSQKRLRDMVFILNRASNWTGNIFQAYAWYRSVPIASFGYLTAQDLVKQDRANLVMDYLARISEGGYA